MPSRPKFTPVEISAMRDASARGHKAWDENPRAVAGAECNTVIELKPEHHAA